jgi:uncharacterized protein DUF4189
MQVLACVAALAAIRPSLAVADGAIAVGLPKDVARQGVALGTSWNYDSPEGARARALQECLSFQDAPADTRKLCKVVQTFKGACVAVALDPQAGTPGVGWAVAPTRYDADTSAMQKCKDTAGAGRQQFCKITSSRCDGQP